MSGNKKEDVLAHIRSVRDRMRITKVVATRSIKGRGGDSFVGFSAEFNSVQDDGTQDMTTVGDPTQSGMTLKDAKVAMFLLGLQTDIAAYQKAAAGSVITLHECTQATKATKANYNLLISDLLDKDKGAEGEPA